MTVESIQSSNGAAIAYARAGSGPPLVLPHGAACDHTVWSAALPLLAWHCTVAALDRPVRAASGGTGLCAVQREVEDIVAGLRNMGELAHLLSHSWRAILAMEGSRRGRPPRNLMLDEPPLVVGGQCPRPGQAWVERLTGLVAAGDHDVAPRPFLHEGPGTPATQLDQMQARLLWAQMAALAHTLADDAQIAAEFRLSQVQVQAPWMPTPFLLGEASPDWVRAESQTLVALLPESHRAIVPGQEHGALFSAPDLFATAVAPFQASVQ